MWYKSWIKKKKKESSETQQFHKSISIYLYNKMNTVFLTGDKDAFWLVRQNSNLIGWRKRSSRVPSRHRTMSFSIFLALSPILSRVLLTVLLRPFSSSYNVLLLLLLSYNYGLFLSLMAQAIGWLSGWNPFGKAYNAYEVLWNRQIFE